MALFLGTYLIRQSEVAMGQLTIVLPGERSPSVNEEGENANATGIATRMQNLYGMGTSAIGLGAIKGVIDDGISKVTAIQSKKQ